MLTESDPTEAPLTEADGLDILSALPTERAALIAALNDLPAHTRIRLQQLTGAPRPRTRHLLAPVQAWQQKSATKDAERKPAPAPTLAAAASAALTPTEDTPMPTTLAAAAAASPLVQRLTRGRILAAAMMALRDQIQPMLDVARDALSDGDLDVDEIAALAAQVGPAASQILTAAVPPLAAIDATSRALMAEHTVGLLAVVADGLAEQRGLKAWIGALRAPLRRPRLAELVGEMLDGQQLSGAELATWAYQQGAPLGEILPEPDRDLLPEPHRVAALGHLAALVALAVSEGLGSR
jgi:hypothetical protein